MKSHLKRLSYGVLEGLTLGRGVPRSINGETIRFPARWSRYYPADYEPVQQAFLTRNACGTVLDLGAHIGLYTVILARRAVRVHAFEPSATTAVALRRTLSLNHCDNVTVHEAAVAGESGTIEFYDSGTVVSNANSIAPLPGSFGHRVSAVSIDDLGLEDVALIKMDVEGAEYDALRGALKTLESVRALALGVHPAQLRLLGRTTKDLWDLVSMLGGHVAMNGTAMSRNDFVNRERIFEVQVTFQH